MCVFFLPSSFCLSIRTIRLSPRDDDDDDDEEKSQFGHQEKEKRKKEGSDDVDDTTLFLLSHKIGYDGTGGDEE